MKLAIKMRPKALEDIVGQEHITNEKSILRKMVDNELLSSIILYGPPGTGKTSIATVIANSTDADFHKINAVSSGKKDIEQVVKIAQKNLEDDKRTILFIDEIHRFNKAQQDYLLPFVEDDTIILIGATTENPLFEVNSAIISRSYLVTLNPISKEAILQVLHKAVDLYITQSVPEDTLELIADQANKDIRQALNILELSSGVS